MTNRKADKQTRRPSDKRINRQKYEQADRKKSLQLNTTKIILYKKAIFNVAKCKRNIYFHCSTQLLSEGQTGTYKSFSPKKIERNKLK